MIWFRDNFDKLLLVLLYVGLLVFVLHMTHDAMDKENIAWGREAAGTVLGALLGLIQGVRLGQAMARGGAVVPPPTAAPPPASNAPFVAENPAELPRP